MNRSGLFRLLRKLLLPFLLFPTGLALEACDPELIAAGVTAATRSRSSDASVERCTDREVEAELTTPCVGCTVMTRGAASGAATVRLPAVGSYVEFDVTVPAGDSRLTIYYSIDDNPTARIGVFAGGTLVADRPVEGMSNHGRDWNVLRQIQVPIIAAPNTRRIVRVELRQLGYYRGGIEIDRLRLECVPSDGGVSDGGVPDSSARDSATSDRADVPVGCDATTCQARGAQCGDLADGCGRTLRCGACPSCLCAPATTCGGGGVPNRCGACAAPTFASLRLTEPWNCNRSSGADRAALDACIRDRGSCSQEVARGWCTRHIDEGPTGLWYRLHESNVRAHCNGVTIFVNRTATIRERPEIEPSIQKPFYYCDDPVTCRRVVHETPIVLIFGSAREAELLPDDGRSFFVTTTGGPLRTDWVVDGYFLFMPDFEGDTAVAPRKLFGNSMHTDGQLPPTTGFIPLADLDDGNGVLDARDSAWSRLRVWHDRDADRASTADEISTLAALGVTELRVDYETRTHVDARGNRQPETSRFTWADRSGALHEGTTVDVHFLVR